MSVRLKVKSKAYAEEARSLRKEMRKINETVRWYNGQEYRISEEEAELRRYNAQIAFSHLSKDREKVRYNARNTFLARAFLRGEPYSNVEYIVRENNDPDFDEIYKIVCANFPLKDPNIWPDDEWPKTATLSNNKLLDCFEEWKNS